MIHQRLIPYLDPQISNEQMGFWTACGVDEALMTLDCMVGASLEWNLPLWTLSVDLRKAFDKLEHNALLDSLTELGLPDKYIVLPKRIYSDQVGVVDGTSFSICRGV